MRFGQLNQRSGSLVRLVLLSMTSLLGGVADSTMSPYFCPVAREKGFTAATCGLVISARFATQIVSILIFGRLIGQVGARPVYLTSVAICSIFNSILGVVDFVDQPQVFLTLSLLLVALSTVGDAGIFCSIYVLAGQEQLTVSCCRHDEQEHDMEQNMEQGMVQDRAQSLEMIMNKNNEQDMEQEMVHTRELDMEPKRKKDKDEDMKQYTEMDINKNMELEFDQDMAQNREKAMKQDTIVEKIEDIEPKVEDCITHDKRDASGDINEDNKGATGPAVMETLYACGTMLGPPVGGLIYNLAGFGVMSLTTGLVMTGVGLMSWPVLRGSRRKGQKSFTSGLVMTGAGLMSLPVLGEVRRRGQNFMKQMEDHFENFDTPKFSHTTDREVRVESHWSVLTRPMVAFCCLVMVTSGVTSSWYLSGLESQLSLTLNLTPTQVGLVYMCPGLVYTLLTPLFGLILDRGTSPLYILLLAVSANLLSYLLMGPIPPLPLSPSPGLSVVSLLLHGLGMSATLIPCLTLMLETVPGSEDESTAGLVTSLWECSELVGGYIGSSLGGLTTDYLGFSASSSLVAGMESVILCLTFYLFKS